MLPHLYRLAVRLHPSAFRARFGQEMLSIFESAEGKMAQFRLLCDCLASSLRQRILRPDFPAERAPAVASADSIPSFTSLDGFRPRTSAVIDGLVLSAALFVLTCFAIRDSWIRVLHVQIPEYQTNLRTRPASPGDLRGARKSKPEPSQNTEDQSGLISKHLQVDVLPVEAGSAALSSDVPGTISATRPAQPPDVATEMALQLPLESYAGIYKSRLPRRTIKIAVKNDQLSMHIAGEASRKLSQVSETEFRIAGEDDSRIQFVQAQNGEIIRMTLSRKGQQLTAERQ